MRRWANNIVYWVSIVIVTITTYTSSSLRVGLKFRRKSEGLAYENTENQYPWHTKRPKIDPQFKQRNESAATQKVVDPR